LEDAPTSNGLEKENLLETVLAFPECFIRLDTLRLKTRRKEKNIQQKKTATYGTFGPHF